MKIPSWLGRLAGEKRANETTLGNPTSWLWSAFGATPSTSGVSVTPENSLETMPVLGAVKLLSGTVASLPLFTYRETNAGKEKASSHPAFKLLKTRANPELSSFHWRELLVTHLLLFGNAYCEIEWANNGSPVALWPIYPSAVRVARVGSDKVYVVNTAGKDVVLKSEDVLHIQGHGLDGQQGLMTAYLAKEAIGLAKSTEQYGASFFGNSAQPSGVLTTAQKISKEGRESLRTAWKSLMSGGAQGVAVLEDGLSYQAIGLAPEHSQFLQSREFSVLEIARLWNIPPHMLASLDRATFASLEQQSQEFVTFCLLPICKRIEAELSMKLFGDAPLFAAFELNALLRGDTAARTAHYVAMLNAGVYSVNEVRALENRNTIGPEGDVRLRPLSMTPLGAPTPEAE